MTRTGLIGVGNMGLPMARRLRESGRELLVHDIRTERAREAGGAAPAVAKSPREVGDGAEIVLLSLPTPDAVRAVATGMDGLAEGRKVKLVVDLSTIGPTVAREVAAAFEEKGIEYLDAPVSGGVPGAEKGTLAVMVSGSKPGFERARPLLEVIGRPILVGDAPGQGQALKLLNNFLSATALAATAEAMALGVKAGLDPGVMLDVFNISSGRNTATTDKFPRSVLSRRFDYGFRTVLLHKDVRLCKQFGDSFEAPFGVLAAVDRAWERAAAELGDKDFTCIVELAERPLGVVVGGVPSTANRARS
jgi:3-hydroxyisobutyrate dehydrogenase-like beta-hydroxyacid dehydrogenase